MLPVYESLLQCLEARDTTGRPRMSSPLGECLTTCIVSLPEFRFGLYSLFGKSNLAANNKSGSCCSPFLCQGFLSQDGTREPPALKQRLHGHSSSFSTRVTGQCTTSENSGQSPCRLSIGALFTPSAPFFHGWCWETFYMFACCGLVGNPHLTAKIYIFAPLPTSTKV